jgi:iturin family lipopeptide synthetase A
MNTSNNKIAVVGMSCRFPGANNIDEYWNVLLSGENTIRHLTEEEIAKFELDFDSLKNNPDYVKKRGVLDNVENFDASFFSMTPKEATETDPQHI